MKKSEVEADINGAKFKTFLVAFQELLVAYGLDTKDISIFLAVDFAATKELHLFSDGCPVCWIDRIGFYFNDQIENNPNFKHLSKDSEDESNSNSNLTTNNVH